MIHISFSVACLLYLGAMLVSIFTIGLIFYLKKKDLKKLENSKLYLCEYCQHAYLDDLDAAVTTCPQCNLINKSLNACN